MVDLLQGFSMMFSFGHIMSIVIGVLIGIIFGAIPGLSGNIAIILFIPITLQMDSISGMLLLLSIFCGATYGGSITAILLGTPGTNSSAATVLDGYPLTKKGMAKKALDIALYASTIGGVLSGVFLLTGAPAVAAVTLKFGPAEFFTISLFGLSVIASVSGKSFLKGLLAGCFGILLSLVGLDTMTGTMRFTFDNYRMMDGLGLNSVLLGLFAITVILEKVSDIQQPNPDLQGIDNINVKGGLTKGEFKQCLPTMIRSSLIGGVIGAVPGVGTGVANFLCYNDAIKSCKNPDEFGTGRLEGVAAPEAGNNGATGTALIPTLTLGVPGAPAAATLMGAFILHGLPPGPLLFTNHGPVTYAILIGFIISNFIMLVEGKSLLPFFVKVTKVPMALLVPILAIVCIAGSFSATNTMFSVNVMLACSLMAFIFNLLKIPVVPVVLGYILGPIAEFNLRRALVISDGSFSIFFTRPISLLFIVLTFVFLVLLKKGNTKG